MKFNRNLTIFSILLAVICLILVSHASAADFDGKSLNDLDNSIKTSDDGNIVLVDDLNFDSKGKIEIDKPITINGNGHSINMSSNQNDVLFDVKSDLTLENIILSGGTLPNVEGHLSIFKISPSANLLLNNVTILNANLGDTLNKSYFANSGNIIIKNSIIKDISSTSGFLVQSYNPTSQVLFENSCFKDSSVNLFNERGFFTITNSSFLNVGTNGRHPFLSDIDGNLVIQSSLFYNISSLNFASFGIGFNGKLLDNVFLNTPFSISDDDIKSIFENNYFGTNTPVEDGMISEKFADSCIKLNIEFPDNDDINNLTVGKEIPVILRLIGDTQLLPVFTVNIASSTGNLEFGQNSITFRNGYATTSITPRQKGEGKIVLGYDFKNPISPAFEYGAYGDLKNYSIEIISKDSISHADDLDVAIELKDADLNPITGSVALFVNNQYWANVDVKNGIGHITLSKLNVPIAELSAYYYHDSPSYNDADISKTISILKSDLDLKFNDITIEEGSAAKITVENVPDDLTSPLYITLSNDGGQVQIINGLASQSFSNLAPGEYKVSIFTLGDNNYNQFDDFVMIYVTGSSSSDDPETPDTPSDPEPSDEPDTPDTPVNPDTPSGPEPSDNPGDSDNPDTPGTPDTPDTPDAPDAPVNPDTPGDYDPSDNPGDSDTPDTPSTPDTPDTPDAPDTPDTPDSPDAPDVPSSSDVPDVPSSQDVPDMPDSGDNPQGDTPKQQDNTNPQDTTNPSDSSDSQQGNNNQQSNSNVNSDSIQSNSDNAQSIDTTTGTSDNAVVSSENSAPSESQNSNSPASDAGESSGFLKSYNIDKVIDHVIENHVTYEAFVLIAAVLLLLIFGYRRKQDKGEDY